MRVLFVCSGNSRFGVSPFIRSQAESLRDAGIVVDLFKVEGKGFGGYLKSLARLRRHLRDQRYDLLHAHYAFSGWLGVMQLRRPPLVVSFMGTDVYGPVSRSGKTGFINAMYEMSACLLTRFTDHVIVKSSGLIRKCFAGEVSVVPNGVDFKHFRPMDMYECRRMIGVPIETKVVLFLGDPEDARKNVSLLDDAIRHLNRKDITVIKPFPVAPKDVPLYLNAANVLVVPSYLEGSPNVVKEAMACSRPVVATRVGDIEQTIGQTKGCYVVPFDAEQLASRIVSAMNTGATTGRKDIEGLNNEIIAARLIELYDNVIRHRTKIVDRC